MPKATAKIKMITKTIEVEEKDGITLELNQREVDLVAGLLGCMNTTLIPEFGDDIFNIYRELSKNTNVSTRPSFDVVLMQQSGANVLKK